MRTGFERQRADLSFKVQFDVRFLIKFSKKDDEVQHVRSLNYSFSMCFSIWTGAIKY